MMECPSCGQDSMKKLVSAVAFRLKGKGWYETDFKSGNKRNVLDQSGSHTEGSATAQDNATQSQDSNTKSTDKAEGIGKPQTKNSTQTTTASNSTNNSE